MLVRLPSGALAPLEVPTLRALLSGVGDLAAVAQATLAHDELDAEALCLDDLFFTASWGLEFFAATREALELTDTCLLYHQAPSARLGLSDRLLAYQFDRACALWMKSELTGPAEGLPDDEQGRHVFGVPDPWDGACDD